MPRDAATSNGPSSRQLGFWMALALVMGNVIGAGVFLLAESLAPLGANAIYGWVLTIAGAMCIAWVLARRTSVTQRQLDAPIKLLSAALV